MMERKKNKEISTNKPVGPTENLTILAQGTRVQGTLLLKGNLRIDGNMEGDISCQGKVIIGPDGSVKGNVKTVSAVVQGALEGDIEAQELILKSGCDLKGNIFTSRLEIESQAKFNGACNTLEQAQQGNTKKNEVKQAGA